LRFALSRHNASSLGVTSDYGSFPAYSFINSLCFTAELVDEHQIDSVCSMVCRLSLPTVVLRQQALTGDIMMSLKVFSMPLLNIY